RVGIVDHRGVHHLNRAAAPHLHVLGQVDLAHAALAELLHDVVPVGDHLTDQIRRGPRGAKGLSVVGTEPHVVGVLGRADGTDLHVGISMRSSLSPTRTRELWPSGTSPRAAIATPLRLLASTTTKSASSERTNA